MNYISGGISGAISDPNSDEAQMHAIKYYEEIRHRTDDVKKISKLTGHTEDQVLLVKNYLFIDPHMLATGYHRFDPSFEIASSWQRLADMQEFVQPHDKLLIPHELLEIELIGKGMSQEDAHYKTCETYNYPKEADLFYANLASQSRPTIQKDSNSGGVIHKLKEDWSLYL